MQTAPHFQLSSTRYLSDMAQESVTTQTLALPIFLHATFAALGLILFPLAYPNVIGLLRLTPSDSARR